MNTEVSAKKVSQSVKWVAVARLSSQIASFVTTIFVLKFISQQDYGLASLAFVFMGILDTIIDFGFGAALIQKQDLSDKECSSVFWLLLGIAIVFVGVSNIGAILAAWFFKQPLVEPLIQILAFTFLASPFQIVYRARLSRALNLRLLAQCDLFGLVIRATTTLIAASLGAGLWCLIIGFMTEKFVIAAVIVLLQQWRPQRRMDLKAIKSLTNFGLKITGDRIVYFLLYRMDSIVVGKFLGTQALGLYTYAQQFVSAALQIIMTTGVNVAYPLFSRHQNSEKLLPLLYNAERLVALISLPILLGMGIVAKDLVLATVGPAWLQSHVYIQALAIAGLFQMLAALMPQLLNAVNRTGLNLTINSISAIVYAAMLAVAVTYFGEHGFLISVVIFQLFRYLVILVTTRSILAIDTKAMLAGWLKSGLPALGMIAGVISIQILTATLLSPATRLTLQILTGAVTYLALNLLIFRQETLHIFRLVRER